jgi:NarL family two-component system response regulator LiaR
MTDSDTIRVLLADDHQMVRQGLAFFLKTQPGIQIVGEAENGVQVIEAARTLNPDAILMDIVMPELDGLEAIRIIHDEMPDIAILVLTSFTDDNRVVAAMQAGALGFVIKSINPIELARAIRTVVSGQVYLQPEAAQGLAQGLRSRVRTHGTVSPEVLTDREQEVLRLLAQGLTNQTIADTLVISIKTVKAHITSILDKLGVDNRIQAALYALRHKIADLDEM